MCSVFEIEYIDGANLIIKHRYFYQLAIIYFIIEIQTFVECVRYKILWNAKNLNRADGISCVSMNWSIWAILIWLVEQNFLCCLWFISVWKKTTRKIKGYHLFVNRQENCNVTVTIFNVSSFEFNIYHLCTLCYGWSDMKNKYFHLLSHKQEMKKINVNNNNFFSFLFRKQCTQHTNSKYYCLKRATKTVQQNEM